MPLRHLGSARRAALRGPGGLGLRAEARGLRGAGRAPRAGGAHVEQKARAEAPRRSEWFNITYYIIFIYVYNCYIYIVLFYKIEFKIKY